MYRGVTFRFRYINEQSIYVLRETISVFSKIVKSVDNFRRIVKQYPFGIRAVLVLKAGNCVTSLLVSTVYEKRTSFVISFF